MTTRGGTVRTRFEPAWALAWVLGAFVFFRQPVLSGFTRITGDNGDARLIVYLHEHWWRALHGAEPWSDPGFFHPTGDVLGYSDTFVLNELFFAPARWAGADMFLAYQITLVLLSLVGFLGFTALGRWILPSHPAVVTALSLLFTFSNMLFVQAGHTQLYSVYWLPALILLLGRALTGDRRAAVVAGLLTGLLLLSTFYVVWFFLLSTVLWLIAVTVLSRSVRRIGALLREHRAGLAGFGAGLLVGLVPFLVVYLPASRTGGRPLGVALSYASEPRDVLNTGQRNFVWGPLTRALYGHSPRLTNGELGFGLTPIVLVLLIAGLVHFTRRYRTERNRATVVGLSTALVAVAAIILPMKFFGVSLWAVIWAVVPGAGGIRAIDRFGVIAGLLAPIVIALAAADVLGRAPTGGVRRRVGAVALALTLAAAVEQFNVGHNADLYRTAENAALAAVPPPPAGCTSFFVTRSTDHPPPAYVSSIDAMLIGQRVGLPTVNGFSGQFPPGYGDVADPAAAGYRAAVARWTADHGITSGLCGYDETSHRWSAGGP